MTKHNQHQALAILEHDLKHDSNMLLRLPELLFGNWFLKD